MERNGTSMAPIPVFDITEADRLDAADRHQRSRKLWSMVFLLAIKDMATVIRFDPQRSPRSLTYQVHGRYEPMATPPRELTSDLMDEMERLVSGNRTRPPVSRLLRKLTRAQIRPHRPIKGLLELHVDGQTVDAVVHVDCNEAGRFVTVYLVDATPEHGSRSEASQSAVEVFRRMHRDRYPGKDAS